jgi:uncharacterized protein (DUF885 family)
VDKLFSLQPKTKFEIRRTEALGKKNGRVQYSGAADGSRPGVFYVPIPDIKEYNMYGDEDLFFTRSNSWIFKSLYNRKTNLPDFRKYNW